MTHTRSVEPRWRDSSAWRWRFVTTKSGPTRPFRCKDASASGHTDIDDSLTRRFVDMDRMTWDKVRVTPRSRCRLSEAPRDQPIAVSSGVHLWHDVTHVANQIQGPRLAHLLRSGFRNVCWRSRFLLRWFRLSWEAIKHRYGKDSGRHVDGGIRLGEFLGPDTPDQQSCRPEMSLETASKIPGVWISEW